MKKLGFNNPSTARWLIKKLYDKEWIDFKKVMVKCRDCQAVSWKFVVKKDGARMNPLS